MPRPARLALLIALALGAAVPGAVSSAGAASFPERIELPDGFQPEGIAIGPGPTAWFGSLADGDIYEVDLVTGEGEVISQGRGTPSVGLKSDRRRRLFVAGGNTGGARVVDTRTGGILARYKFTTDPSFVNDVVLTKDTAWFTDSQRPVLYGLPVVSGGWLPDPGEVIRLSLSGDWEQVAGFNANGIAQTPDQRALLVVQSSTGLLFRVSPETGEATRVDLGGTLLTNGDGLLVVGRTLYAVQNRLNQVAVIELNRSGSRGTLVDVLTSADFDVPTTIAAFRKRLYLPNARFTTLPEPTTPYWVTQIKP